MAVEQAAVGGVATGRINAGLSRMGTPDAYPFPTFNAPVRFAVAIGAVGLVFLLDRTSDATVDGSRFLLLATAVMASAWFAGTGPALAATVAGALLGALDARADGTTAGEQAQLAIYVVHGLLLTAVVSELRRARREAEQQAREAERTRRAGEAAGRMKDEFLATISHELRTPLNAVLGWVHLLRTGNLDAATSARGMESIERNVRLQARLTGDLLDVSKAVTGTLQMDCRPISLTEVARQTSMTVASAAHAKRVNMVNSLADAPVTILGDWMRLRQVVWHLLTNAIKFTPQGGTVNLTVEQLPDQARLIVSDSGPGIAPDFLPRVFERFSQADSSSTRPSGGLGVGLSLVRDIVDLHGGFIEAGNRADGPGAMFVATFPLQPAASLTPRPVSDWRPAGDGLPLDGLRVLVLERDTEAREMLRRLLEQRGATVCVVESVSEALEALESWQPDALINDGGAGAPDSYTLVARVRTLDEARGGRIPAAALTVHARRDERLHAMLSPVQRDLPKPVEPAVLTSEIARLTGRERRHSRR